MNHGPDDQSSTGLDSDELALRGLLHQAVQEIEPRDGTLDHLRKAVPARRARKRQAVVGMAAAALFIGTAVPALVHVSNSTGTDANPSVAGHYSQAQGGSGEGKAPDGGESTSGTSSGKAEDKGKGEQKEQDKGKGTDSGKGTVGGTNPSASMVPGVPVCTATELSPGEATTDVPDSAGTVYGTFRYTNTSASDCTVSGPGTITPTPAGAADATKISAVRHTSGDAAAGLPDPSLELTSLLLKPGSSYDVKFAWVPSETCPTTGGGDTGGDTGNPTPDPTPTENPDTTTGSSTGGDTGTSTQMMTEDGTADGSVTITNTGESGGPATSATVTNACAGVVYWTGVLAAS
ncbi:hypothetical protein CLM62_20495 [Streptomyces sp. SA15]|uniref:hypothetical protein n=1 Tax=Streptomyces sp. SA15 TaxID=934019 RepID=UPI000BB01492|nr:hypothetical protein [Streptomyces sp. SA15]PAZ13876.1 hypothetical protein CLM62_20495 [Streptomyces sp. SA15]